MGFFQQVQHFFGTYVTFDNIENLLEGYRGFGPFLGILLPALEAFLPFLPLIVFVLANAAAYGFVLGFLFSWIGTVLGSLVVFLIVRWIVNKRLKQTLQKNKKIQSMLMWIDRHGFGLVFFVLSIPFTPSSLINVVSGLSNISPRSFFLAVMLGKMVMIGIITLIGTDWQNIVADPKRIIPILVGILVFWLIGRFIEKKLNKNEAQREKVRSADK
ncbi:MAG: TVP38/TMEM64 family protein [Tuberibacillus sp.]